jgi:hypothetical protein
MRADFERVVPGVTPRDIAVFPIRREAKSQKPKRVDDTFRLLASLRKRKAFSFGESGQDRALQGGYANLTSR